MAHGAGGRGCIKLQPRISYWKQLWTSAGVHNAKAEECTTPGIGSRNIEIKIGVGGLPRNQK